MGKAEAFTKIYSIIHRVLLFGYKNFVESLQMVRLFDCPIGWWYLDLVMRNPKKVALSPKGVTIFN